MCVFGKLLIHLSESTTAAHASSSTPVWMGTQSSPHTPGTVGPTQQKNEKHHTLASSQTSSDTQSFMRPQPLRVCVCACVCARAAGAQALGFHQPAASQGLCIGPSQPILVRSHQPCSVLRLQRARLRGTAPRRRARDRHAPGASPWRRWMMSVVGQREAGTDSSRVLRASRRRAHSRPRSWRRVAHPLIVRCYYSRTTVVVQVEYMYSTYRGICISIARKEHTNENTQNNYLGTDYLTMNSAPSGAEVSDIR